MKRALVAVLLLAACGGAASDKLGVGGVSEFHYGPPGPGVSYSIVDNHLKCVGTYEWRLPGSDSCYFRCPSGEVVLVDLDTGRTPAVVRQYGSCDD